MTAFEAPLNKDFSDLRTLQVRPSMTDDDNEFHSDMLYFRDLLNAIVQIAVDIRQANPFPAELHNDLTAMRFWLKSSDWQVTR